MRAPIIAGSAEDTAQRVENLENMLLHGSGASIAKLKVRNLTATLVTTGAIKTGLTAPYVQIDSDGVLAVAGVGGSAGLRLKSDGTGTITEVREDDGGLAISSDQTDYVSLALYDSSYTGGATNRRLFFEATDIASSWVFADKDDSSTFEIACTYSSGDTEIKGLDSGDLVLSSASGQVKLDDELEMADGENIVLGTTTGTKFGTATNQKAAFFNATPVVQESHIVDADGTLADVTSKFNTLLASLETYGLLASS